MKKNKCQAPVPVSVSIARWSAIAAVATAVGSIVNTIWTSRPWWAEDAASVQKSIPRSMSRGLSLNFVDQIPVPMTFAEHIEHIPAPAYLIVLSVSILLWWSRSEYSHRKNVAKFFRDTNGITGGGI